MLHLLSSNSQDVLATQLAQLLQLNAPDDPFQSTQILVQSDGMANWLKLQLANKLGQCANLDFIMPSNFFWQCYRNVLPHVPERSPFAREQLRWRVAEFITLNIDKPDYSQLKQYHRHNQSDRTQAELAEAITDIFDHYLMYRPDWLLQWETGDFSAFSSLGSDLLWQGKLWQGLVETVPNEQRWHRANIAAAFSQQVSSAHLPKQLFVFGISNLPPIVLHQLHDISHHCEVYIFWQNPSSEFWQELNSPTSLAAVTQALEDEFRHDSYIADNNLLANLGQHGRDFIHQLIDLDIFDGHHDINFNLDQKVDLNRETLLAHVQHDILSLQQTEHPYDRSIQLSSSYSPAREIQALRDNLLARFDADPSLTPGDVVVIVPSIEDYAPFFSALFNPVGVEPHLPIAISDRSELSEQPIYNAISSLLGLSQSRFTRSDAFDLLEIAAVRSRFGIEEKQLNTLREWCALANVHWGFDDAHWEQQGNPPTGRHHWCFAIERLLQSMLFSEDAPVFANAVGGIKISGTQSDLLSNFIEFIETLQRLYTDQQGLKCASQWHEMLANNLPALIDTDHEDCEDLPRLLARIDDYFHTIELASYRRDVSFATLSQPLLKELLSVRNSQRFAAGRINVCTFLPMRSIPFRVVALLGMDSESFPRRIEAQQFDLSLRQPRVGDRHPTREDRYLFLEALLAAEDALYLSWVGRSIKNNEEQPPSIVIAELLNYLETTTALSAAELHRVAITEHPLQAFNELYFEPQSELFSFDQRWLLSPAPYQYFDVQPLPEVSLDTIELETLLSFYRNPLRSFLKQLGVSKHYLNESIANDEPFEMEPLNRWKLYQILNEQDTDDDINRALRHFELSGSSPAAGLGEVLIGDIGRAHSTSIEVLQSLQPMDVQRGTRRVAVDNLFSEIEPSITVSGTVRYHSSPRGNVIIRYDNHRSAISEKSLLAARIEQAFLCAAKLSCRAIVVGSKKTLIAEPLSANDAVMLLSKWIDLYHYGLQYPLPLNAAIAAKIVNGKLVQESDIDPELALRVEDMENWLEKAGHHAMSFVGDSQHCFEKGSQS